MQNSIEGRLKCLLEHEIIQKQKEQQVRNQNYREENKKIIEEMGKASKDQGKSLSRDLVNVQFRWEKIARKVWIKVRLFAWLCIICNFICLLLGLLELERLE